MLKVVIADDEPRVCRLVRLLADWDVLDMEVVATAANGLEALACIEAHKPHILITDIRMPGCDGLELIERAKALAPNLEIVIISGHAQFEYAQTALRHGVGDYLLKPIQKDALMSTLEKLGKRCRGRLVSEQTIEHLHQDSLSSTGLLHARLVEDLMLGRLDCPTPQILQERYHVEVQQGLFQVYLLKMDYDPDKFSDASAATVREKAEEIFTSAIASISLLSILEFRGSGGCGIVHAEGKKRDILRRTLRDCLNQLEAQKFFFGTVEFSLSLGIPVNRTEDLPQSALTAKTAIYERLIEGTGRMFTQAPAPPEFSLKQVLDHYDRAITHAIESLSIEEAEAAATALEKDVLGVPGIRGRELIELVLAAGKLFIMRINLAQEAPLLADFDTRCNLCSRASGLFVCLHRLQRQQIELALSTRESEEIRPIRIARQYIQQHYMEPITLEDVCAATGFSVSYFSTMFKKETGEGFSKYLTRVRIDRAKELLQSTTLPAVQVCQQVGYSDLKHFNTTFKKMTGLNPGQYRRLYG